ncbi:MULTISPECIES: aureocin A53 family class IId bacteriocin [Staphylococcus]|uniref:Aureocin-like type II bacteriocin n=1 Tax=Staphylococcus intermedius NCTC 11048 TaxID=1141106 RepID=A0A380FZ27_STAIN|nr:aureocin A53 family class IId bacteriocin [Staphylococcus intermedius]PCF84092.1 bacteriocin aureocin A53 [Staphylococcus intermedius]PNZ53944.1 bacteriocin aureocin A53 [Staphylococcus intermedius NCTC 11048]SUM43802.1 Aureocin-like type II bacteriocin [Staphylococcus intermedius NCTC 11048]
MGALLRIAAQLGKKGTQWLWANKGTVWSWIKDGVVIDTIVQRIKKIVGE